MRRDEFHLTYTALCLEEREVIFNERYKACMGLSGLMQFDVFAGLAIHVKVSK